MTVEIDDKSGFCFGVVNAISKAEKSIGTEEVFSLGDIVHNRIEVQRLEDTGLRTIHHSELDDLHDKTLLIRAHGEPPSTYETARANRLKIIDATCPVVEKLQKLVKTAHEKMVPTKGQVVILGKRGHAEVVGLTGQVGGDALVIEGMDDLDRIDFTRPICLLSQTTQSLSLFNAIGRAIMERAADKDSVTLHDTICRQVANREPHLKEFAARFDVIIFVSGQKSSNGKVLFGVCKASNTNSHFVEDQNDLNNDWFTEAKNVGVCGATSTPKWLMKKVADRIATIK